MNAGENHAVGTGTVVQRELEQLLALFHRFAGFDLHRAEIALGEGFKIHVIREQRLDFHLAEIDDRLFGGFFLLLLLRFGLDGRRGGGRGQRLHRRDFKLTLFAKSIFLDLSILSKHFCFSPILYLYANSHVLCFVWRINRRKMAYVEKCIFSFAHIDYFSSPARHYRFHRRPSSTL